MTIERENKYDLEQRPSSVCNVKPVTTIQVTDIPPERSTYDKESRGCTVRISKRRGSYLLLSRAAGNGRSWTKWVTETFLEKPLWQCWN